MTSQALPGPLGAQIWLEPTDSADRVDALVRTAVDVGLGQLRCFVMWPWIQAHSRSEWDFRLFDDLFASAQAHGLSIKATLTANSGPWWLGTPSALHSYTLILDEAWWPAVEAYVDAVVRRYAEHPALGQWILWNEPMHPVTDGYGNSMRPRESGREWVRFLEEQVEDIDALNERWRTGYGSFADVPLAESVAHPQHANMMWRSFGPELLDARFRAELLHAQLLKIARLVRAADPATPLCINPSATTENHAIGGYRLERLAEIVDVLGASFHAPWHLYFAPPRDSVPLVVAGLSLLQTTAAASTTATAAEVTEVQIGNTFYAGHRAQGITPTGVAATYLSAVLAGAQSVTGWCLNTRSQDFEAGEWGLLEDDDSVGDRALAVRRVHDVLGNLHDEIGEWSPDRPTACVAVSADSQAVEMILASRASNPLAADPHVAARSAALIAIELGRLGVATHQSLISHLEDLPPGPDHLLVASNLIAWETEDAEALVRFAEGGGTLLVDATSGEFNLDAQLHRPWPGVLAARLGLRNHGLRSDPAAATAVGVDLLSHRYAEAAGVRAAVDVADCAWQPITSITFSTDSQPVLWERSWGSGRVIYCAVSLGHSLLATQSGQPLVRAVLDHASQDCPRIAQPLSRDTSVLGVHGPDSSAVALFGPHTEATNPPLVVRVKPGRYRDLWSGRLVDTGPGGLFVGTGNQAIAVLVPAAD